MALGAMSSLAMQRQRAAALLHQCCRAFSSTERILLHDQHDLPAAPEGIVELREYTLRPDGLKPYLQLVGKHVEARKRLSPFLGMFFCDTGSSLTTLLHFYHYRDYAHRAAARAVMAKDAEWQREVIDAGRLFISSQTSSILRHSPLTYTSSGARSASAFQPSASSGAGSSLQQRGLYVLLKNKDAWPGAFGEDWPPEVEEEQRELWRLMRLVGVDLVFAGATEVGPSAAAPVLLRLESAAALDEFLERGRFIQQPGPWKGIALLQPTDFSPWQ